MASARTQANLVNLSEPKIRRADIADAGALTLCIDHAYARHAQRIPDRPQVSEGMADDIADNQVWVAVQQGEGVAGLILAARNSHKKLSNVAVHPAHGGKGPGRRLVALAVQKAHRHGYGELRLNTHVAMPENLRLYAHLGWEEIGRSGNTVSMRKGVERG